MATAYESYPTHTCVQIANRFFVAFHNTQEHRDYVSMSFFINTIYCELLLVKQNYYIIVISKANIYDKN